SVSRSFLLPFFFQAEDGIRAFHVTGVQTCALPIYAFFPPSNTPIFYLNVWLRQGADIQETARQLTGLEQLIREHDEVESVTAFEIGRASCREGGWGGGGGGGGGEE